LRDPFFLLGAERAGLLLLELMLTAHPGVRWGGDFDYALAWTDSEHADWPPLIPYWQQLALSPRVKQLRVKIDPTLGFADLVRSLLDQQRGSGDLLFGVAAHDHYDRALRLWPRARFLHLARSTSRGTAETDAASDAQFLRESDRLWRKIAAEIEPNRRLELRYETLVADLPGELRRVCDFLGLGFDAGLLRVPVAAPPLPDASRAEASAPSLSAPGSRRFARAIGKRVAQLLGE
jgi:hypothetical protein